MLLTIDPPTMAHQKGVEDQDGPPPGPRVARPPIRAYQKHLYHQQPLTRCYDIV